LFAATRLTVHQKQNQQGVRLCPGAGVCPRTAVSPRPWPRRRETGASRKATFMPYRTLCEVLQEMRTCFETRNFSYLPALIEEVQWMGNRMEAGLYEHRDYRTAKNESNKLRKSLEKLRVECEDKQEELKALKNEIRDLQHKKRTVMAVIHQFGSASKTAAEKTR
jgi:hypothetical protein